MFLLYGFSPSGKTEYFKSQFPGEEVRILHASSLSELRNCMATVEDYFLDPMPTLVNVWFDLDCKTIQDIEDYDVYVEAHYLTTHNGPKEVKVKGVRYLFGLRNKHLVKKRKHFIKKKENEPTYNYDWIKILGTRYRMIQGSFPETVK